MVTPIIHQDWTKTTAHYLARRLHLLLHDLGLLARRVGTTKSAISRLESGHHAPTVATLHKVASAFDRQLVISFGVPAAPASRRRVTGTRSAIVVYRLTRTKSARGGNRGRGARSLAPAGQLSNCLGSPVEIARSGSRPVLRPADPPYVAAPEDATHQSIGDRPPIERFRLAAGDADADDEPKRTTPAGGRLAKADPRQESAVPWRCLG